MSISRSSESVGLGCHGCVCGAGVQDSEAIPKTAVVLRCHANHIVSNSTSVVSSSPRLYVQCARLQIVQLLPPFTQATRSFKAAEHACPALPYSRYSCQCITLSPAVSSCSLEVSSNLTERGMSIDKCSNVHQPASYIICTADALHVEDEVSATNEDLLSSIRRIQGTANTP